MLRFFDEENSFVLGIFALLKRTIRRRFSAITLPRKSVVFPETKGNLQYVYTVAMD